VEEELLTRIGSFFGKIDELSIKTSNSNDNAGQRDSSNELHHTKQQFAPLEKARRQNYESYLESMKKTGITPFSFEEWQQALDK